MMKFKGKEYDVSPVKLVLSDQAFMKIAELKRLHPEMTNHMIVDECIHIAYDVVIKSLLKAREDALNAAKETKEEANSESKDDSEASQS